MWIGLYEIVYLGRTIKYIRTWVLAIKVSKWQYYEEKHMPKNIF